MKKDILFKDRGEQYVFADKVTKLLHGKSIALSSTHFRATQLKNNRVIVKSALEMVRAYFIALKLDPSIKVVVTKSENSADPNTKKIAIALDVLSNDEYTPHEKVDTIMGEALHEAFHFLYTNFKYASSVIAGNRTMHSIINIIEDEYIERRGMIAFPGYALYLRRVRRFYFKEKFLEQFTLNLTCAAVAKTEDAELIDKFRAYHFDIDALSTAERGRVIAIRDTLDMSDLLQDKNAERMNILLNMIRYPENLDEKVIMKNLTFFEAVRETLSPYPDTSEKCAQLGRDIYFEHFDIPPKKKEEDNDDEGDGCLDENDATAESVMKEKLSELKKKSKISFDELVEAIAKVYSSGIEKDLLENEKIEGLSSKMLKKMIGEELMNFDKTEDDKTADDSECGESIKTKFHYMRVTDADVVANSTASRKKIGTNAGVIRRALSLEVRDVQLSVKGTRNGVFDTNRIVEAVQGVQSVYQRHGEIKSKKCNVVFIFDESASMVNIHYDEPRYVHARDVAAMADEALNNIPGVKLFMYGYTSDNNGHAGTTDIFIYREPGVNHKHTVGMVKARWNNRDGTAIREISLRVRKFTDDPIIYVMVSDGMPMAHNYSGFLAKKHTGDEVQRVIREQKAEFIHIAIGPQDADAKKMYPLVLDFKNVKDLPTEIGRVMKNFIQRKIKATAKYDI